MMLQPFRSILSLARKSRKSKAQSYSVSMGDDFSFKRLQGPEYAVFTCTHSSPCFDGVDSMCPDGNKTGNRCSMAKYRRPPKSLELFILGRNICSSRRDGRTSNRRGWSELTCSSWVLPVNRPRLIVELSRALLKQDTRCESQELELSRHFVDFVPEEEECFDSEHLVFSDDSDFDACDKGHLSTILQNSHPPGVGPEEFVECQKRYKRR